MIFPKAKTTIFTQDGRTLTNMKLHHPACFKVMKILPDSNPQDATSAMPNLIDHIRLRPAMYIGSLQFQGIMQMIEYLFEDILEVCRNCPVFDFQLQKQNGFTLGISNANCEELIGRLNELAENKGGSVGLGLATTVALAGKVAFSVPQGQGVYMLNGDHGILTARFSTDISQKHGLLIQYEPDQTIFREYQVIYEYINDFLRQFALLNPGLKIISTDCPGKELQRAIFYYPAGVKAQFDHFISQQTYRFPSFRLDIEAEIEGFSYRIGLSYIDMWGVRSYIRTYANNTATRFGGSLEEGIVSGLSSAVKTLGVDLVITQRALKDQLVIIAAVRGKELNFAGATKEKLDMPKIKKDVRRLVHDRLTGFFVANKKSASYLIDKFTKYN